MKTPRRANIFDAFRLIAALMVIVGHAYILTGNQGSVPVFSSIEISMWGVAIFFTISGYLIWKSWFTAETWHDFVSARILRIMPALVVVVLVTTFVMGPIVTNVLVAEYFSSLETYRYLLNIFMVDPQYSLPGVFTAQPFSDAVNGSLWTLRAELVCYALVPLATFAPRVLRLPLLVIAGFGLIWVGLTSYIVIFQSSLSAASLYWGFFAVGAAVAQSKLDQLRNYWTPFIVLVLGILFASLPESIIRLAGIVLCSVSIILIGKINVPLLRSTARFGDFSYGIYLVAFPIQQILIMYYPGIGPWESIFWVTLISLACAIPLWKFVESTALDQKLRLSNWLKRITRSPV